MEDGGKGERREKSVYIVIHYSSLVKIVTINQPHAVILEKTEQRGCS